MDRGNAAVVLFGQFPFACDLITAARRFYRYKWVWKKKNANAGFLNAYLRVSSLDGRRMTVKRR